MPKKSTKEVVWVKLKTQYKLAKMFEEDEGVPHYKAPLAFANWSMYIPVSAMGKAHRVIETSTYPDDRLYKIAWGGAEWWVSEKFITRKFYVLEVDCE